MMSGIPELTATAIPADEEAAMRAADTKARISRAIDEALRLLELAKPRED